MENLELMESDDLDPEFKKICWDIISDTNKYKVFHAKIQIEQRRETDIMIAWDQNLDRYDFKEVMSQILPAFVQTVCNEMKKEDES